MIWTAEARAAPASRFARNACAAKSRRTCLVSDRPASTFARSCAFGVSNAQRVREEGGLMFCAIENSFHHGAHGGTEQKDCFLPLLRALRDLRGEARLRFTKFDTALRHLTLLDLFIDLTKRSHRGSRIGESAVWPGVMDDNEACGD